MIDSVHKYLFEDRTVRIETVNLEHAWQQALEHQHYPDPVCKLLGELCAACLLLASNIKFEGSLVLQIQGDGPVALIVVECDQNLRLRATAKIRDSAIQIPNEASLQELVNQNGRGRCILILDPKGRQVGMQPYQGIVALEGNTLSEILEQYMKQSEQLDTRLYLAADSQHCCGLLLQRLPHEGGTQSNHLTDTDAKDETWSNAVQFADTLTPKELLECSQEDIIHRLYWNNSLLAFEPQLVQWYCPCNRDRVASMLKSLGEPEVQSILDEQNNRIEIKCDFCGKPYLFDSVDCKQLFV